MSRSAHATRTFRARNRAHGLCHCGNERRVDSLTGKKWKTCIECHARGVNQNHPNPHHRSPTSLELQPRRGRRVFVKMVVDMDPDLLQRFQDFCVQFDDMPVTVAIDDAIELYMAVAHQCDEPPIPPDDPKVFPLVEKA